MVLTAVLMVGLATVAIDHAAANQFKIANVDLARLAGPAAVPAEGDGPVPFDLRLIEASGPAVTYGATEWTVTSSRLIASAENASNRPIVVAEVVVGNTSETAATRVRSSDVALVGPEGERVEVDRFEFIDDRRVFSLDPGESLVVTLVFKPNTKTEPDLTELTLTIGEPGRVPAELPLHGSVVAPYPISPVTLSVADQPIAVIAGGPGVRPGGPNEAGGVRIVAERLTLGLDAGHYRAALGQRVLSIDASVEGMVESFDRTDATSTYLDPSYWKLNADGRPVEPLRVTPTVGGFTLIFAIADGSTSVVLQSGASGSGEVHTSFDVPGTPE